MVAACRGENFGHWGLSSTIGDAPTPSARRDDDADPTARDDNAPRSFRATLLSAGLAARAGAGRRHPPRARQAHRLRRVAGDGPPPDEALDALPPRAQPRQ